MIYSFFVYSIAFLKIDRMQEEKKIKLWASGCLSHSAIYAQNALGSWLNCFAGALKLSEFWRIRRWYTARGEVHLKLEKLWLIANI